MKHDLPGPIVVGGVGGSGTRVVAHILDLARVYLGDDLNDAFDNLWFTVLLKRPGWYREVVVAAPDSINGYLGILGRVLTGGQLTGEEVRAITAAAMEVSRRGHDHRGAGKGGWPFLRVASMLDAAGPDPARYVAWGWKEPNSHIFLPQLAEVFPELRYLHVMRHGFDMAYSRNQTQVYNWAPLFGLQQPSGEECPPQGAFRYWAEANRRAVEVGTARLADRFLLVDFDELCNEPGDAVGEILRHLGLKCPQATFEKMVALPTKPPASGRYRALDTSWIGEEEQAALHEFGYEF